VPSRGEGAGLGFSFIVLAYQLNCFFQAPNMVRNARFPCGNYSQGLMNPPEIVEHNFSSIFVFAVGNAVNT
jgi:hypothetical protein